MSYFDQQSERLFYRKFNLSDASDWVEFFQNNSGLQYLGLDGSKSPEALAMSWITRQIECYNEDGLGHLAVILKSTGELIGCGGLLPRIINDTSEFEIAYSLKPRFWQKGYGTEIARQIKAFAKMNLAAKRVISIIHKDNQKSIRVAEKNEMHSLFEMYFKEMPVKVYGCSI